MISIIKRSRNRNFTRSESKLSLAQGFFFVFILAFWLCLAIEPVPPAVEAWSLIHWTTRAVPPSPLCWTPNTGMTCLHAVMERRVEVRWYRMIQTEYLCPPKFIGWNLIPDVMVWRGGTFERWLGPQGGAPMDKMSALRKDSPESSFALSIM